MRIPLLAAVLTLLSGTAAFAQGDECTGAIALVNGANGPFSNVGSTTSVPAWPCAAGGNDVWFFYVATCTGTVTVDTCGGGYDSCLEAFSGTCGALTSLGCDDDGCAAIQLVSRLSFPVTSGVTYYVRLGGFGGATGSTNVNVTCFTPPPGTLSTTFASNNGGAVGGGVYFDVGVANPAGITITGLDVDLLSAAGTAGTIDVFTIAGTRTGNQTNQPAWTLVSTGTVTAAGVNLPSAVTLATPIPLAAASTSGFAFRANGVAHAYTNGTGGNQNYSNADLSIAAGEASNVAFVAPLFTPRVVNCTLYYSIGISGTLAVQTQYGANCYDCFASIYDNRAAPTLALNGQNLLFTASGSDLVVTHGGAYTAPTGAATALALIDDSETTQVGANGTYTVCSNGFISAASGNGTSFTPAVASLLNNPQRAFYTWHDFNPAIVGSGQVKYENVGGVDVFTWDGVWDFGGTTVANANTLQWRFDAVGNAAVSIVTMSGLGNGLLVGYSPAGSSRDPGNTDLTTLISRTLCGADGAITLGASARPLIGTTFNLVTSQVPAGASFSALVMGFAGVIPPLDLTGLGMPGCFQHIALGGASTLGLGFTPSWSFPFFIPNVTAYVGTNLFAQSAAFVPGVNPLGATSSNGLRLLVGNL